MLTATLITFSTLIVFFAQYHVLLVVVRDLFNQRSTMWCCNDMALCDTRAIWCGYFSMQTSLIELRFFDCE